MNSSISSTMKFLVALCFVAAVAQAVDIDWTQVQPMYIEPEAITGLLEESASRSVLQSRIVGGYEADQGAFPYQVAVLSTNVEGTGFCGGSILNENWILTAAHCLVDPTSVVVLVAAHTIGSGNTNAEQYEVPVESWIIHEDWDPATVKDDIAVLKLSQSLTFSDLVQPTRLPSRSQVSNTFVGTTGIVSGWGRHTSGPSVSPVLRYVSNPIIALARCNLWYFGLIINSQICLAGNNGRSSCNGDSGGPLVIVDSDGLYTQVGVVSHGIAFGCSSGWPGVYARTSSYLDWLNEKTGVAIRD